MVSEKHQYDLSIYFYESGIIFSDKDNISGEERSAALISKFDQLVHRKMLYFRFSRNESIFDTCNVLKYIVYMSLLSLTKRY